LVPLRPGEVLALRWREVDLSAGIISISRTIYRGTVRNFTKTTREGEVSQFPLTDILSKL
jgi:integrase